MKNTITLATALLAAAAASAAPTAPGQQSGGTPGKAAAAPPDFTVTYAAPDKKSYADFSAPGMRTPSQASFVGLQYGTGKTEVAYIVFDPADAQSVPDRAYIFFAGSTNPPVPVRGRTEPAKQQRNVKVAQIRGERFALPPLRARINSFDLQYKIEIVCGQGARANVHMTAETSLKAEKPVAFNLHANLSNICVPVPNEIKVIPLFGKPALQIHVHDKVNPPWIRPYVHIGESLLLEPIRGMDSSFALELKSKETGKTTDKGKLKVEIPPFSGVGESGAGAQHELKGAKAGTYEAHASMDLGPLGYPSVFVPVNVPVPVKEKKK